MTEELFFKGKKLQAQIKYIDDSIYKSKDKKEEEINKIRQQLAENENYDMQYNDYVTYKNQIAKDGYSIKGLIENDENFSNELKAYNEFAKDIQNLDKNKDKLKSCENSLKSIVLSIINKYLSNDYKNETQEPTKIQAILKGKEQKLLDMKKKINGNVANVNIEEFIKLLDKKES